MKKKYTIQFMYVQKFNQILVLTVFVLFASLFSTSNAATITVKDKLPVIVIEGEIEKGDFEKFVDAVLVYGAETHSVILGSRGGDAIEAIKIGNLIRDLALETQVPVIDRECKDIKRKGNCTCLSACPLIFVAGVKRSGNVLGVHRIYLSHDKLKDLTLEQSRSISMMLEEETNKYLKKMDVPASFLEKIDSMSSDKIEMLSAEYVEKNFNGYIKGMDEWLVAKCGNTRNTFLRMRADKKSDKEVQDQMLKQVLCARDNLRYEQLKKYYVTINDAISKSNSIYIPKDSKLQYLKVKTNSEIWQALSLNNSDAVKFLSLFGIGAKPSNDINELVDRDISVLDHKVFLMFDSKGILSSIVIRAIDDKEYGLPFNGFFIKGLTNNSRESDFEKKYGEPAIINCKDDGTCFNSYGSDKYYLKVSFNQNKKLEYIRIERY